MRQDSYAAGAASDWTPITSISGRAPSRRCTRRRRRSRRRPARTRRRSGSSSSISSVRGADAGDQERLVAGVDVAVAVSRGERLGVLPRLVEVVRRARQSAPSARIAATFTGLALSGTQIARGTPNSRAAKATDCPWLPVEAGDHAARALVRVELRERLMPPRTLNAPTGWWFSCLTQTSAPTSSLERRIGLGAGAGRYGAMWRRAARTSASVTGVLSPRPGSRRCRRRRRRRSFRGSSSTSQTTIVAPTYVQKPST